MQRRSLWFLVAIAGVGLMLLGCGGGLLALTLTITEGEPLTGVETMPIAGIVGWGFGFGIPLMLHGVAGWRGRSSRPFSPPRVWGLWLVWMLLLGLGTAISFFSWAPPYLLPPVHVLAMSLPPLIILWLVGRALGEATGSWREVVAVMVGGSSLGLGLSLVSEMLVGLALVAVVGVAALMMPGGQERILALVRDLQNSAWLADFANLAKLLLSPVVAVSVLGMLSILVPLIEEGFKTLAAGVVARWTKPHPARAFLWGVASGAGFALAENLFNGALGGGEAWAMGAVTRLGATVMHCATGGLVGWGWGQLWAARRPLRLVGSYVAAVAIHGIWNGVTVAVVLISAGTLTSQGGQGSEFWSGLAGFGAFVFLGMLGLLTLALLLGLPLVGRRLAATAVRPHKEDKTAGPEERSAATSHT